MRRLWSVAMAAARVCALALPLAHVVPVQAQPAEGWQPPPARLVYVLASRSTTADGRAIAESQALQITGIEEEFVTVTAPSTDTLTQLETRLDRGLLPRSISIRSGARTQTVRYLYDRALLHALWPLQTGKRVQVDIVEDLGLSQVRIDYTIAIETGERDQVEIQGRAFDTWRLIITREQDGQIVAEAEQWYAPSLSTVLKSEVIYRPPNGPEARSTTEVSQIGLRPE